MRKTGNLIYFKPKASKSYLVTKYILFALAFLAVLFGCLAISTQYDANYISETIAKTTETIGKEQLGQQLHSLSAKYFLFRDLSVFTFLLGAWIMFIRYLIFGNKKYLE